jgi:hypothetical protein
MTLLPHHRHARRYARPRPRPDTDRHQTGSAPTAEGLKLFRTLLANVPSIYRSTGENVLSGMDLDKGTAFELGSDDPFTLLVYAMAENQARIDNVLDLVPEKLNPRTAPTAYRDLQHGFLEFLAGWVAIDPAVLGTEIEPLPNIADSDRRIEVLRHLVTNAAALHAARGTSRALRYLLEIIFDADVEILEWHWPTAFQVGVTSVIGINTMVTGPPPLDRCITLLWDSPRLQSAVEWARTAGDRLTVLELNAGGRTVGTVIETRVVSDGELADPDVASGRDTQTAQPLREYQEKLQRVHVVLRRELPAHITSYVGFRPRDAHPAGMLPPFIVGIRSNSTIGSFQIQRRR